MLEPRKLDQDDVIIWNSRLNKFDLELSISQNPATYQQDVVSLIRRGYQGYRLTPEYIDISKYAMNYSFSYSVSTKSIERFDKILNFLLERGFHFSFFEISTNKNTGYQGYRGGYQNVPTSISLTPVDLNFTKISTTEHKIHNDSFVKRDILFSSDLLKIIYFITCIQDTIDVLERHYDYDKDGVETCNIPYKIGSVISFSGDIGQDYFIQDYIFHKLGFAYLISKIEHRNKNVLLFSEPFIANEESVNPNRDDRIESILTGQS